MFKRKRKLFSREFKFNKFERDVKYTIEECKKVLKKRRAGIPGDFTADEISYWILPELYHYLYRSMRNIPPPSTLGGLGVAHECPYPMVDSSDARIADLIMHLDSKYFR
ncbi:MAG: hypothetical protein J1F36_02430 [Clostridiales bacterium]|nr:hypothetical protein [Clostridiales bacterium]